MGAGATEIGKWQYKPWRQCREPGTIERYTFAGGQVQVTSFVLQDESIAKKAGRSFSWPTIAPSTKKEID